MCHGVKFVVESGDENCFFLPLCLLIIIIIYFIKIYVHVPEYQTLGFVSVVHGSNKGWEWRMATVYL